MTNTTLSNKKLYCFCYVFANIGQIINICICACVPIKNVIACVNKKLNQIFFYFPDYIGIKIFLQFSNFKCSNFSFESVPTFVFVNE